MLSKSKVSSRISIPPETMYVVTFPNCLTCGAPLTVLTHQIGYCPQCLSDQIAVREPMLRPIFAEANDAHQVELVVLQ